MVFSSIPFLYYFLPVVLLLYFAAPKRLRNGVLLLASLVFYAWGEPRFVIMMAAAIGQGYLFGILIEASAKRGSKKVFLTLSVVLSLGLLGYFKYADFLIAGFNAATGLSLPLLRVTLPVGISFFTFQILSYVVDVYRGTAPAQRNLVDLAAYIAMFPQLIAGPIVRYSDIAAQLKSRSYSLEKAALGIRRFVIGLGKKVLIANALGELCSIFKASGDKSVLFFWLYALSYTLHIYFDFSGYSDMAIGLGRILGFTFLENFNYPYISRSITAFWRRWHISLGSWFRDYLYIPLGGNRVSRGRWLLNILIVWVCTGFWHGAAWNFMVWGLLFGLLLILEKLWLGKLLDRSKLLCHVYVMLAVTLSFVIFDSASLREAWQVISAMFGAGAYPAVSGEALYYLRSYLVLLLAAVLGATPLAARCVSRLGETALGRRTLWLLEPLFLLLVLLTSTAYIVDGSFNPFLYFRF